MNLRFLISVHVELGLASDNPNPRISSVRDG
jgi:hypothetical protein